MWTTEGMRRDARVKSAYALSLLLGFASGGALAQTPGDPEAGARKAGICAGCHGIAGWRNAYPAYRVPKLGGQTFEYLVAALNAYKTGQRAHLGMQGIAKSLSDEDIADIAAFLARNDRKGDAR